MRCEACTNGDHWLCDRETWCARAAGPEAPQEGPHPQDAPLDPWVAREFGLWDVYEDAPDDEEDTP
jgi:hypothetical protein